MGNLPLLFNLLMVVRGLISHPITRCETSYLQGGFECEKAFDGDLTTYQTPGFIGGWVYGAHTPAWVVFYLASPVTINTIIFKTGIAREDHHLNDFSIEVLVGGTFEAVTGTKVNNQGATIWGSRVQIVGQEEVRIAFDKEMLVTAVKINAYGSDAANENCVVNEIYLLNLENVNNNWGEDVDVILNEILQLVKPHPITRCETSYLQGGFECEKASDGDLTTYQTPGFIGGWAYGAHTPAWVVFYLASPVTINTIIFKTGIARADHHLNDFSIEVLVGGKFGAVTGMKVNNEGASIWGSRVQIVGQEEVRIAFDN